jgi:hypothetical protein
MAVHNSGLSYRLSDDGQLRHQWRLVSKTKWVLTLLSLMVFGTFLLAALVIQSNMNYTLYCGSLGCNTPPDAASAYNGILAFWILSIVGTVAWLFVSNRKYRALKGRLTAHLDRVAKAALAAKPVLA